MNRMIMFVDWGLDQSLKHDSLRCDLAKGNLSLAMSKQTGPDRRLLYLSCTVWMVIAPSKDNGVLALLQPGLAVLAFASC